MFHQFYYSSAVYPGRENCRIKFHQRCLAVENLVGFFTRLKYREKSSYVTILSLFSKPVYYIDTFRRYFHVFMPPFSIYIHIKISSINKHACFFLLLLSSQWSKIFYMNFPHTNYSPIHAYDIWWDRNRAHSNLICRVYQYWWISQTWLAQKIHPLAITKYGGKVDDDSDFAGTWKLEVSMVIIKTRYGAHAWNAICIDGNWNPILLIIIPTCAFNFITLL